MCVCVWVNIGCVSVGVGARVGVFMCVPSNKVLREKGSSATKAEEVEGESDKTNANFVTAVNL